MGKFIDLTGQRFGRWTVLYRSEDHIEPTGVKRATFHCRCDCGKEADVIAGSLRKGLSKSCGCMQLEYAKSGDAKRTHGKTGTRLHRTWKNMHTRCYNKNNKDYIRYGQRGITVCQQWQGKDGFENFYLWAIDNGYQDNLTIDRIDNDGPYCPDNCRWVDNKTQCNNTSKNRLITIDGTTKTISEWIDYLGVSRWKLYYKSDKETEELIRFYLNQK